MPHIHRTATSRLTLIVLVTGLAFCVVGPGWAACPGNCPFDLIEDGGYDVNGIALNPKWRGQTLPGETLDPDRICGGFPPGEPKGKPQCIGDRVYTDEPKGLRKFICNLSSGNTIKGHINWYRPATFIGRVSRTAIAIDRDYNWDLEILGGRILTANRETLHTEAHGTETVDKFSTPWWGKLRDSLFPGREALTNGKPMVVTGLLNLDSVHGAYTELHPIYALAVRTDQSFDATRGLVHDHWAILVRNWGNQGFCSRDQHNLVGLPSATCSLGGPKSGCSWLGIDLPLGRTAEVLLDRQLTDLRSTPGVAGPIIARHDGGLSIRFTLPPPSDRPLAYGEIAFFWRPASDTLQPISVGAGTVAVPPPAPFENLLELLEENASPEAKSAFDQSVQVGAVPGEVKLSLDSQPQSIPYEPRPSDRAATPSVDNRARVIHVAEEKGQLVVLCSGALALSRRKDFPELAESRALQQSRLRAVIDQCREDGFLPSAETR